MRTIRLHRDGRIRLKRGKVKRLEEGEGNVRIWRKNRGYGVREQHGVEAGDNYC